VGAGEWSRRPGEGPQGTSLFIAARAGRSRIAPPTKNFKEESFFDKPRSLSEVAMKLEESGHLCPVTTLSGVMLGLVQKRLLSRVKRDGVWMYGKR